MGILTYAQQNLRVELKESWYEHHQSPNCINSGENVIYTNLLIEGN